MQEQFVTYEIALKLKELGFNEPCFAYYDEEDINHNLIAYTGNDINSTGGRSIYFEDFLAVSNEDLDKYGSFTEDENGYIFDRFSAPLWQQAITWLFKKLDFYYPYLKIEVFSDGSGTWYQPKDEGNNELEIDFDNLEQAILKVIELTRNTKS